ncbi:MAG TPA: cellulase family glycosylhydrolase [Pyrinomonadaceae bacterium]|nr:cellulase family glycosylhydrolase [Pyrinomonadaceae bacterium]
MRFRFVLAAVALVLSLNISADNRSIQCNGCWEAFPRQPSVEESLGVNIHFVDPQPGEIRMIADAGFRWIRTDFVWQITEREAGRYDFSAYDRLLRQLDEAGLHALFILDYGNTLYTEGKSVRTAEARAAFARWAVAAAQHFAGRGVIWEVFNEPNNKMFWPPTPNAEEYNALASEVGRAFRATVPNEKLIGPAIDANDVQFLESCLKAEAADSWSAVSLHPYRQTNPETAAADYARVRELINKHRDNSNPQALNITSSEWGYSSSWARMNEERQAIMLTRSLLTNIANGIPLSIWYDWRDDGSDPRDPEDHFGLVRHEYTPGRAFVYEPKPAYLAARTLTATLQGFRFQERLNLGSVDDYVLVFNRNGERRLVAWTTAASPHRLAIRNLSGEFATTTISGSAGGRISAGADGLSIDVSAAPVYLVPAH